jgi:hypothetical protein
VSFQPPPPAISNPLAGWIPGIWPIFVSLANRGLSNGGATTVTSWWRSSGDNARVGGEPESQHLLGLAFDAVGPNPLTLAAALRAVGFVVVEEPSHIHAQAYRAGTLGPVLRALGLA